MSSYNDIYNYESFPSDDEYELEENQFQVENEKHFDKYCDILNETFNDMKKYTENQELLQYLTNYMELDTLFHKNKYEFSNNIIQTENKKKKNDIYIPGPITWSDNEDDDENNNLVTIEKKPLKQKYKQRRRKNMTKNLPK